MSEHYENHATETVNAFLDMLDAQVRDEISEAHRNELTMLIEAAISTAVFEQLEHAANEIDELSRRLRNYAEHYDKASKH